VEITGVATGVASSGDGVGSAVLGRNGLKNKKTTTRSKIQINNNDLEDWSRNVFTILSKKLKAPKVFRERDHILQGEMDGSGLAA
jgi:hypothetical protein